MMKLTKEECLEAIKSIEQKTTDVEDYSSIPVSTCCYTDDELNLLEQLIKEYFENPPLKFEEIEKGMWVWNERNKEYAKVWRKYIASCHNDSYVEGTKVIKFIYQDWFTYSQEYKENEIYKKQVDENE